MDTIKIKFLYEGKEHEINASGLGDLGWQLDGWGADSAGSDDDFTVISIELIPTNPIPYLCLQCGVPLDGRPHYYICETNNPEHGIGKVIVPE